MKKFVIIVLFFCFLTAGLAAETDDHIEDTGYIDWMHQVHDQETEDEETTDDETQPDEDISEDTGGESEGSSSSEGIISYNDTFVMDPDIQETLDETNECVKRVNGIPLLSSPQENIKSRISPLCDTLLSVIDTISDFMKPSNLKTQEAKVTQKNETLKKNSKVIGDPVYVVNGQYSECATDYNIRYLVKTYSITRTYTSETDISGAFGKNWLSSLDSRLVFGISPLTENDCNTYYNDEIYEYRNAIDDVIREYSDVFGKTSENWNEIADEIESASNEIDDLISGLTSLKAKVKYQQDNGSVIDNLFLQICIPNIEKALDKAETNADRYSEVLSECRNIENDIAEALSSLSVREKNYRLLVETVHCNEATTAGNKTALLEGTPDYYRHTGLNTISFVDDSGNVHVFSSSVSTASEGAVNALAGTVWNAEDDDSYDRITKNEAGFTLSVRDGSTRSFTLEGLLSRITDAYGNWISFNRNNAKKIISITTSTGKKHEILWNGNFISCIRPSDGSSRGVSFSYSAGRLSSVTDEEGDTVSYRWQNGLLSGIIKPDSSAITFRFDEVDPSGKPLVTSTTNEEGFTEHFDYDFIRKTTLHTDHSGVQTLYYFDDSYNIIRTVNGDGSVISPGGSTTESPEDDRTQVSRTYSPKGLLVSETVYKDRPVTTTFSYDSEGCMTKAVTGSKIEEWTWENGLPTAYFLNGKKTYSISYGDRSVTITSLTGLETTYFTNQRKDTVRIQERDSETGEKRITDYEYDRRHLVTAVYKGDGTSRTLTERYRYDGEGRTEAAITFRNGGAVILLYGFVNKHGIRVSTPVSVCLFTVTQSVIDQYALDTHEGFSGADLKTLSLSSDDCIGLSLTDNAEGSQILPAASQDEAAAVFHYNEEALPAMIEKGNRKEWYRYDEAGNVSLILSGGTGSEADADYYVSYSYDGTMRNLTVTEGGFYTSTYILNAWGEPVSVTDGNGNTTLLRYDCSGNVSSVTDAYGNTTYYEYDPSDTLIKTEYPDGSTEQYGYEALSAMCGERLPNREMPATSYLSVNSMGNVTEALDENSHLVFLYDKGGRLIRQKNVTSGSELSFEYDRAGNRTLMTDGTTSVSYSYGLNGELVSVTEFTGTAVTASAAFTYDSRGRETVRKLRNGVTQTTTYASDGSTELVVQYDSNGRLIWGEGFLYDAAGRISASITSDAFLTLAFYDENGRLIRVLESDTEETEQREREEASEYALSAGAAGEAYYLTPDTYYALKGLLDRMQSSLGNALTVLQGMRRTEYAYDESSNRLTKTTAAGTIRYEYDDDDRLTQAGNHRYTYDASGNLLSDVSPATSILYEYTSDNRMLTSTVRDMMTGSSRMSIYGYDPLGRRISRNVYEEAEDGSFLQTGSEKLEYDGFSFDFMQISSTFY